MRYFLMMCVLFAGCSGCEDGGDETPWTFGEPTADTSVVRADAGGRDSDVPDPPLRDMGGPPPDLPGQMPCFGERLYLVDDGRYDDRHIVVAGDRVFIGARNDAGDIDTVEWTPDGLQSVATGAGDQVPWAASDDWLWLLQDDQLEGRRLNGGAEARRVQTGRIPWPHAAYGAQPRQLADGDRVAWMSGENLHLFDGDRTVRHPWVQPDSMWVGDAFVTWVAYDGSWYLRLLDGNDYLHETVGDTAAGYPVVVDDAVIYVRQGRVWRYRPGVVEALETRGVCGPLYSDGEDAVFACDPDASASGIPPQYFWLHATELWRVGADDQPELLYRSDKASIYGPVIAGQWVAWAEYPDEQAEPVFPMGTVKVMQRWAPEYPRDVATIGQGCQTCGAYWPPPFLDIDRNTLALTYAGELGDPAGPPRDPRLGYVGIVRLANCD